MLPANPATAPVTMKDAAPIPWSMPNRACNTETITPMIHPPTTLIPVPNRLMPPLVPGGHGFNVVSRMGCVGDRIPSYVFGSDNQ